MAKTWFVDMRFTQDGWVLVEAESEEEALEKANACNWLTEHIDGLVDWEVRGEATLDK